MCSEVGILPRAHLPRVACPHRDRDWAPPTHLGLGVTLGRQWAHRCPLLGRQGRPRQGPYPGPLPTRHLLPLPQWPARVPGQHKESFVWAAHYCSPLCGNRAASLYQALRGGIKGRCRGRGGAVLTDRPYLAPRLWDTLSALGRACEGPGTAGSRGVGAGAARARAGVRRHPALRLQPPPAPWV